MAAITNLVILGDSLSDIDVMREKAMGEFARFLEAMRVNGAGRFSDGQNWTDFLTQWAGLIPLLGANSDATMKLTRPHKELTKGAAYKLAGKDAAEPSSYYVNYAQGGAMGADDYPSVGLGVFKTQYGDYIKQRRAIDNWTGNTLHIIWFGLNDLVTNDRGVKHPGTMNIVAQHIAHGMKAIGDAFDAKKTEYFLLCELPMPSGSERFQKAAGPISKDQNLKGLAKVEAMIKTKIEGTEAVKTAALLHATREDKGAVQFNESLGQLAAGKLADTVEKSPTVGSVIYTPHDNVAVVSVNKLFDELVEDAAAAPDLPGDLPGYGKLYGFVNDAQAHKEDSLVWWGGKDTGDARGRSCMACSDNAHPTERLYKVLGVLMARTALKHHTFQNLATTDWAKALKEGRSPIADPYCANILKVINGLVT